MMIFYQKQRLQREFSYAESELFFLEIRILLSSGSSRRVVLLKKFLLIIFHNYNRKKKEGCVINLNLIIVIVGLGFFLSFFCNFNCSSNCLMIVRL